MHLHLSLPRLLNVTLAAALLGILGDGIPGCCMPYVHEDGHLVIPCLDDGYSGTVWNVSATILDMGNKKLPIVLSPDDDDAKDVQLKTVKQPQSFLGETLRVFRGKQDGSGQELIFDRELGGDFVLTMQVQFDDPSGLVDGQTAGRLFIRQIDAETPYELGLTATYDLAGDGLEISAHDEAGPLGDPLVLAGVQHVSLGMTWDETGRSLTASPVEDEFAGFEQFQYMDEVERPDGQWYIHFGVTGLGKGGELALSLLRMETSLLNAGSNGEIVSAFYAHQALGYFEQAWTLSDPFSPFPNPELAAQLLDLGNVALQEAKDALDEAAQMDGVDGLHRTTNEKVVRKQLKRGTKRAAKAAKLGHKLAEKESDKTKSLSKKANQARWAALLIRAELFGFKSTSIDEYFRTLIVEVS